MRTGPYEWFSGIMLKRWFTTKPFAPAAPGRKAPDLKNRPRVSFNWLKLDHYRFKAVNDQSNYNAIKLHNKPADASGRQHNGSKSTTTMFVAWETNLQSMCHDLGHGSQNAASPNWEATDDSKGHEVVWESRPQIYRGSHMRLYKRMDRTAQ